MPYPGGPSPFPPQFAAQLGMPTPSQTGPSSLTDGSRQGSVAAAAIANGENPLATVAQQQQQQHVMGVPASLPSYGLHGGNPYLHGPLGLLHGHYFGPMPGSSWSSQPVIGVPAMGIAASPSAGPTTFK